MGVCCDVGYEDRMLGHSLPAHAILAKWHVRPDECIAAGGMVADLQTAGGILVIRMAFPCLVDALVAEVGERLDRGSVLLRVFAEGEDVPEGYRYATTDRASEGRDPAS